MRYRDHKERWQYCTACPLHENRHRICLLRGKLPADVLFIGEAPGSGENTLGKPFVGPAGDLLQHMIDVSLTDVQYTYAMTNLVACMPVDEEHGGDKTRPPTAEEVQACSERLLEAIRMVKPKLIIAVGKRAADLEHTTHWIPHPASILRAKASGHMKEIQIQRWTAKLTELVKKGLERRKSRGRKTKTD